MTAAVRVRVLIADDHAMVRSGLVMGLEGYDDIEVVGEAVNGIDAVRKSTELCPDVVLMDMRMPLLGGAEATRAIMASVPKARVLILTSFSEPELVREAMRAGAVGFILKDANLDELAEAVRAAARGESTISAATLRALMESSAAPRSYLSGLDLAERQVLELLLKGLPSAEIRERLGISASDLDMRIAGIISWLGAEKYR